MKKTFLLLFVIAVLAVFLCIPVFGEEAEPVYAEAEGIGFSSVDSLFDGNRYSYAVAKGESKLTLAEVDSAQHLYIEFDLVPEPWTVTDTATGKSVTLGENGFLHQYVNISDALGAAASSVELSFPDGTSIADIYLYTEGELPEHVQIWDEPCEKADIMLVSSHSDDEQLFFAGILPYYAIERRLNVQVVYMVQHFSVGDDRNHIRSHEQLDGLWTVGIRNYPLMTDFPDVYSESADRSTAFRQAEAAFGAYGVTYEDFCSYLTGCIRRFKPLVVVTHDLDGEYGHGTHVLCASAITEAIGFAADPEKYPESYEKYGVWQTEKTYLHLYEENKITMDWDTPYDSMGGKTPFQMTQEGFNCHQSQHWCWFYNWIFGKNGEITKASQITYCSPCEYGLYDSRVGMDTAGGDFMENLTPWAQREPEELPEETETETVTAPESSVSSERVPQKITLPEPQKDKPKDDNMIIIFIAAIGIAALMGSVIILLSQKKKSRKRRRRK